MVVKVVSSSCLQWTSPQPSVPQKRTALFDTVLASRSGWLGTVSSTTTTTTTTTSITRSRSLEYLNRHPNNKPLIKRSFSASLDSISDEEFSRKINDLTALRSFQIEQPSTTTSSHHHHHHHQSGFSEEERLSIEMRANSVDLPVSLRMIKRKNRQGHVTEQERQQQQQQSGCYCSVKKAFSSMVFIIRELHSFTLQMRELLFYEDLQGIITRVQSEMHASFVWLFQQIFSHTPTLMVSVMLLMANFTVHEMSSSAAIAAVSPPAVVATVEERDTSGATSSIAGPTMTPSSTGGGKTASVGGGGGSKARPVGSGTEGGDGWGRPMIGHEGVSGVGTREEEEVRVWNEMVEEASRMRDCDGEVLDHETVSKFVSPVTAKIDGDVEYEEYFRTELKYQTGLAQEPDNVLLLANYAQFLYLVAHDYDRAEEYFKRAIGVEPKDAEAHNKYATFLWQVRNDLWAAEETFLEAISADPSNSFYAANYAHFLWNTGGEDTCYPLSSPDEETLDDA